MLSRFSCVQNFETLWTSSLSGSSVHGTLQQRILEWVTMPSSRPLDMKSWLWKIPWCCEPLTAGREGDHRGLDGWMALLTQWTWVWANSERWWRTGKHGVLLSMGSQRVRHDWTTEQEQFHFCLCPVNFLSVYQSVILIKWSASEVAQSCPTLCDPMDCSLSGSSIHGIFQARLLEWIAIFFSRGSSWPRNQTRVSRRHFTVWATREAQTFW